MSYSLAVDIGGTFTDIVLRARVRPLDRRQDPDHPARSYRGLFHRRARRAQVSWARAARRRRRRRSRHHGGHQCADRAQGTCDRAPRHGEDFATSCASATSIVTRCTIRRSSFPEPLVPAGADIWHRGARPRRRQRAREPDLQRSTRSPRNSKHEACARWRSAFSTASPIPRHERIVGQADSRAHSRPVHHLVVGRRAADPRVPARLDRDRQRLHDADLATLSARLERTAGGRRLSELAADHAELRRSGRRRYRRPQSGAHDRERPGGRRARRLPLLPRCSASTG